MDNAIGGYFELELSKCEEYHKNAIRLNSGKNSLYIIIQSRKFNKVFIPYYTCSIVLKPFEELKNSITRQREWLNTVTQ